MISLSLLPTPHPPNFQLRWVRSSSACYRTFNLDMGRSHGFRVYVPRLNALLGLAFATAPPIGLTLPRNVTHRPIMQKVRGHALPEGHSAPAACRRHGFRYYFTPLAGVLFTFPSRYWFTIGRSVVFSLGRWSSQIPAGLHVSCGTRVSYTRAVSFHIRGCHPLWPAIPCRFVNLCFGNSSRAIPSSQ